VKVPRFAFEKFPHADDTLTTHMKSVGEAMAIGRNFTEALGKALRSLEDPKAPFDFGREIGDADELLTQMAQPHDGRIQEMMQGLRAGASVEQISAATVSIPGSSTSSTSSTGSPSRSAPQTSSPPICCASPSGRACPTPDRQLRRTSPELIRELRWILGVRPVFKTVDTCAAEFAARTPYHYSSYDEETELEPRTRPAC
jgi:carbamoyl-phosphate synthase large subunit